jgi:hypothetical protein
MASQNLRVLALALAALAGAAAAAGGAVPPPGAINADTVAVGAGTVVTWQAPGEEGELATWYAISRDGRTVDRVAQTDNLIRLRYASFDPLRVAPAVDPVVAAPAGSDVFIVQFISQPLEVYREAIRARDGAIERFLADNSYIVRMSAEARGAVAALPFVRWVGPFHPAYKLDEPILQAITLGAAGTDFAAAKRYSIMTLGEGEGSIEPVVARIEALGGRINARSPATGRLEATVTLGQLLEVARMNEVLFIDPWGPREPDMDIVRMYSGTNYVEGLTGFSGQGVRGEVFDTGLYTQHQEFSHQSVIAHGHLGTGSHGTGVASVIFARGVDPLARGIIPDAQLIAANSFFDFAQRYEHTGELVDPDGPYRADFQVSATGSPRSADYTTVSAEMDRIALDHDLVICQAHANSGMPLGRPQSWSKNVLSVGSFLHRNTLTRADDAHDSSGGTGPATDGRVKPDLSSFYDGVYAADSGISGYWQFGGSSAAVAVVAGHVGLLHQMWHEGVFPGYPLGGPGADVFESRPHMTTSKAILINTADKYPIGFSDFTRFNQGWGQVDVARIYDDRAKLHVVDQADLLQNLEVQSYDVTVTPGDAVLKMTMVYPDLPGTVASVQHRINDLSLRAISPSGDIYWGNAGLIEGDWSIPGGSENHIDTVENVFIESPEAGVWRIEVVASEINEDGHPATPEIDSAYSLVINGGSVIPPPLLLFLVSDPPDVMAPGEGASFMVDVFEGTQQLAGPPQLHFRYDGGSYQTAGLEFVGGDRWEATLPAAVCGDKPEFYVEAIGDGGAVVTAPAAGAADPFTAAVGVLMTAFSENFEAPTGWTVESDPSLTGGEWEVGVPVDFGRGDPPSDYDGSGRCFLTENNPLTSNSDVDGGPTVLISPVFDLSALAEPQIEYARWFGLVSPVPDDRLEVDFSDDGGVTWTNVERAIAHQGWVRQSIRVSEFVEVNSQFRMRLSIADVPNNDIVECGLDALAITTFGCACYADCDGSGELDFFDFLCFQDEFAIGAASADCDGSGELDFFDFLCFQNEFAAGCP